MRIAEMTGWIGAGLLALAAQVVAAPPADVADLVGVKGRDGETELISRGYQFHHGAEAKDGKLTFWKNGEAKSCIEVLTKDGRYASIEPAPAGACQSEAQ